ncbi:MAG: tetratricopeptide repeat protein [Planctomycetes bacterium]|nr:tetratricopeptide repeat protein [Planctomycetota bacterium]MBM4080495.1 tetratricopeptide repeat protein [Planctomycetota bacterium]
MQRAKILLVFISLVGFAGSPALAQEPPAQPAAPSATDTVTLKSNRVITGRVAADTYEKVDVEVTGADGQKSVVSSPAAEVREVRYGDQPSAYAQAMFDQKQGKHEAVVAGLDKLLKDPKSPRWMPQYALLNMATSYVAWAERDKAQYAQAQAAFERLVKEVPNSRFTVEARLGLSQCCMALGQHDKAAAALADLVAGKFGEGPALQGELLAGKSLEAQEKVADAEKKYAAVAARGEKGFPELATAGLLNRAGCLTKMQKYADAQGILVKLAKEAQTEDLKALAYNNLGECLLAQKELREAQLAFLRVVVLYFKVKDEHGRALYWSGQCFEKRGDPSRANELYDELRSKYPNSAWAKKVPVPEKK